MHKHKFNATILKRMYRCSCGAWAHYDHRRKVFTVIENESRKKALETLRKKFHDPDEPVKLFPRPHPPEPKKVYDEEPADLVEIFSRRSNPNEE